MTPGGQDRSNQASEAPTLRPSCSSSPSSSSPSCITYWAAKRTKTSKEFYAAGRTYRPAQNGLALAGDYMSAA